MLKPVGGLATEKESWMSKTPPKPGLVTPEASKMARVESVVMKNSYLNWGSSSNVVCMYFTLGTRVPGMHDQIILASSGHWGRACTPDVLIFPTPEA